MPHRDTLCVPTQYPIFLFHLLERPALEVAVLNALALATVAEARLRAVRHEILRQLREQALDFLVNEHRTVVDFRRIDPAQSEIQEILQRAEVYCPDDRRPERIRKRVARDFAFLSGCDEVAVVLDRPAAAVIVFLLDVFAGLHDLNRSHEILCRIAERRAIVDIMGRAACI